jgi:hypothetical protein
VLAEAYFEMPKQDQFYQSPIESLQSFSVYFFSWYVIFCVDIAPIFQMQNAAWNHGGQSQSAHHPKNFMTKAHTTTAELAGIGQGGQGGKPRVVAPKV